MYLAGMIKQNQFSMLLDSEFYEQAPHEVSSTIWMGGVDMEFIRTEIPGFAWHSNAQI
jgi:hypothetical protein